MMRTRSITKEELAERLLKKFGYNEPIFTSEIVDNWGEYSRPRVFQLLKELLKENLITKSDTGVYYFPTVMVTGKLSVLGRQKIMDKKFIRYGEETFGYYSGISLLNGLHLMTQMPFHIELVSSKASANIRKIKISNSEVTVRRSRVPITKKNVHALMLLEAFTEMRRPLDKEEAGWIREFVEIKNIKEEDVIRYSRYFPMHTLESLFGTGIRNVFT